MSEAYARFQGETMMEGVRRRDQDVFVNDANVQLLPEDRNVEVTADDGPITCYLPPVTECRGMFISILLVYENGGGVIVDAYGSDGLGPDDAGWSPVIMASQWDWLLLYSNGRYWVDIGCDCGVAEIIP